MGQKKMLIVTMLCVSMFQMGMVALAPVVSAVVDAFPGTSALAAQTATTFLNLVLVAVALFSGAISRHIGRRMMCARGMLLFALAGVCGTFFTVGLWSVFLWSAFLGAGTGLFVPAVSSMMIDYLDDGERSAVAGIQTAFVNLGGMALSFFAGGLAGSAWSRAYLVFLAAVPVFFLCLRSRPSCSLCSILHSPPISRCFWWNEVWRMRRCQVRLPLYLCWAAVCLVLCSPDFWICARSGQLVWLLFFWRSAI